MSQSTQTTTRTGTVREHMRELQLRFFTCIIMLIVVSCVTFLFYKPILKILSSPLGSSLYYSSPAGGFAFIMKICLAGALIVTIPVLIYNLIMFTRPAFEKIISTKEVLAITGISTFLAFCGAVFAYFVILPGSLNFFEGFQVDGLKALISADDYFSFIANIMVTFAAVFQIPLIISFIDRIKPLKPEKLFKFEKWVILGSLIIALIVPFAYEFFTSLMIAMPIIILYNFSIALVLLRHANQTRKEKKVFRAQQKLERKLRREKDVVPQTSEHVYNHQQAYQEVASIHSSPKTIDGMSYRTQAKTIEKPSWVIEREKRIARINSQKRKAFADIRPARQISHASA